MTQILWSAGGSKGLGRRVSVATLSGPCHFSVLPGVDRTLVPIDAAVKLRHEGADVQIPFGVAFRFSGEDKVEATDAGRPIRVLNVMTKRDEWYHDIADNLLDPDLGVAMEEIMMRAVSVKPGDMLICSSGTFLPSGFLYIRWCEVSN